MKLKNGQILTYGMGSLAKDLVGGVVATYLLVFYTDIFGITAAAAGMIMMLTRIWDAINDPMMGALVDKTNTKWGRYRPYIFIMPFFMGVLYWLTFTTPNFSSNTAMIVYATVTYTLAGMAFTAYDVPLWGMVPALTNNPNERNKLITSQRIFTFLAYLIVSVIAYPVIYKLGGGTTIANQRVGYSRFILILGILSILFGLITSFTNKERIKLPEQKSSFKQLFGTLKLNKYVPILLAGSFFMYLQTYTASSMNIYYLTYYLGREDLISIYMLVATGSTILGMFVIVPIINRIGRLKATIGATIMAVILQFVLLFIGKNVPILLGMIFVIGILNAVAPVTVSSLIADAADFTQWKTGIRTDGIIFSLNSFVTKLAMALASGLAGIGLTVIQYIPNAAMQSNYTMNGINILRYGMPIISMIIGIIVLRKYDLSDEQMAQIHKELEA